MSTDILENMYSADHYDHTKVLCMTDLAQVIEGAHDAIMTVVYRKKLDEKWLAEELTAANINSIDMNKFSK
jgi:hypothetical protein